MPAPTSRPSDPGDEVEARDAALRSARRPASVSGRGSTRVPDGQPRSRSSSVVRRSDRSASIGASIAVRRRRGDARPAVLDSGFVGAWRSLVAHQSGGLVVVGSNPAAPTNPPHRSDSTGRVCPPVGGPGGRQGVFVAAQAQTNQVRRGSSLVDPRSRNPPRAASLSGPTGAPATCAVESPHRFAPVGALDLRFGWAGP